MSKREKILLTSLSPTPKPITYYLNNNHSNADQSPVALLELLDHDELPDKIFILCTEKILEEQFSKVKIEILQMFNKKGISYKENNIEEIFIPDGRNFQELWEILTTILKCIPPNIDLILDITHSFRHLSFLYFMAAIYLQELQDVKVQRIYYGMEQFGKQESIIHDLFLLLNMVEWFYAVRIFKETGQANNLIKMLESLQNPPEGLIEKEQFSPYSDIKKLLNELTDFNYAYAQGLPNEMGIDSAKIKEHLKEIEFTEVMKTRFPIPEELIKHIDEFITPLSIKEGANYTKNNLPLNIDVLEQQANVISTYLHKGHIHHAIGIMRELFVSIAIMHNLNITNESASWLKFNSCRRNIESKLNVINKIFQNAKSKKTYLTDKQNWLADTWNNIHVQRNNLAHHGHTVDNVLIKKDKIEKLQNWLNDIKEKMYDNSWWQLNITRETNYKTILISPLGLSKGLLFSAIKHTNPDFLLVITSQTSKNYIDEIIQKANYTGKYKLIVMREPFSGFAEAKEIAEEAESILLQGEKFVVNITGGTTAMQYIVQKIADDAKNINAHIKTFALVDRRTPEEQRINPYELGEIVWLDDIIDHKD